MMVLGGIFCSTLRVNDQDGEGYPKDNGPGFRVMLVTPHAPWH